MALLRDGLRPPLTPATTEQEGWLWVGGSLLASPDRAPQTHPRVDPPCNECTPTSLTGFHR